MPYQREAVIVLEMWRTVEQAMAEPGVDSDELEGLQAEAARLRDEYQRLIAAAMEHDRPLPPPFPGGKGLPLQKEPHDGTQSGLEPAPDPQTSGA